MRTLSTDKFQCTEEYVIDSNKKTQKHSHYVQRSFNWLFSKFYS